MGVRGLIRRPRVASLLTALVVGFAVIGLSAPSSALAIEANGSYIRVSGTDPVYEVIGGAAIHVDSCAPLDGCPKEKIISSLAGYATVPANGTEIQIQDDGGWLGAVVGGALIHIDSCAPLGGCSALPLDPGGASDYMNAHPTPTPGSFLRNASTGWIGEVIGAAVIHVDSCASFDNCAGVVNFDPGGLSDYMNAHPLPPDGSFIRAADGPYAGWIGEVIGTSLIHVDDCAPLGGCAGVIDLDGGGVADYIAAHPLPANGTFVQVADGPQAGLLTRVAGGALLVIGDCGAIGSCGSADRLDAGGYDDWVAAHPTPVTGTVVLGLPSNTTWEIVNGERQQVPANPNAVPVDDASLDAIPLYAAASAASTITPPRSSTLRQVRLKFAVYWRWFRGNSQLVWIHAPALKRPLGLSVRCAGKGCPFRTKSWTKGSAKAFLASLAGSVYRDGDRLTLTVSHRHESPERILFTVRDNRAPRSRLSD